jgi:secondary thiamine-phosphate synthase enzyme
MAVITIDSRQREELIDITAQVQRLVSASGLASGVCHLWCRHTTAGLTMNENADPDVPRDLLMGLSRIVSDTWPFRHSEGNSPAHLKSLLTGCQLTLPVRDDQLSLGRWQGVFFVEYDGPRAGRQVEVSLVAGLPA